MSLSPSTIHESVVDAALDEGLGRRIRSTLAALRDLVPVGSGEQREATDEEVRNAVRALERD